MSAATNFVLADFRQDGQFRCDKLTMRNTFLIILCALCFWGCASHTPVPALTDVQGYHLVNAVNEMVAHMSTAGVTPKQGEEIAQSWWPVEIQGLHPVAVYNYDRNVVIVMQRSAKEEEGYFVLPPSFASSMSVSHPLPSDKEWVFKPIEDEIGKFLYEYHRKKK